MTEKTADYINLKNNYDNLLKEFNNFKEKYDKLEYFYNNINDFLKNITITNEKGENNLINGFRYLSKTNYKLEQELKKYKTDYNTIKWRCDYYEGHFDKMMNETNNEENKEKINEAITKLKNLYNPNCFIYEKNNITLPVNEKFKNLQHYYFSIGDKYNVEFKNKYNKIDEILSIINNHNGDFKKIDVLKALIYYIFMQFKPNLYLYKNEDFDKYKKDYEEFIKIVIPYFNMYIRNYKKFGEDDKDLYQFYFILLPKFNQFIAPSEIIIPNFDKIQIE